MTRLIATLLILTSLTWLAHLGDVPIMHWKVLASGVVACLVIAYSVMVLITNRWAP